LTSSFLAKCSPFHYYSCLSSTLASNPWWA
jgi:hypothetical protein